MNVTFNCPQCHRTTRVQIASDSHSIGCTNCQQTIHIPEDAITERQIHRCLVCPSTELFARKDFPQRLGVALVIIGFVGSSIAWFNYQVLLSFGILFVTALIDLVLYIVMGESLTCYRCHAQYRGFDDIERHGGFDLETHERYRQMAARMKAAPPAPSTASGK